MAETLVLGGIAFQDWEVPDHINFGGGQQLIVHKLIGGQRVVDAMGPDPENIAWSGRFRGGDAVSRAQAVDAMRQAGAAISLTWGGLFYTVVIQRFHVDYSKAYELSYQIECVVSDDPAQAAGSLGTTLGSLISADLGSLSGIISSLGSFSDFGF